MSMAKPDLGLLDSLVQLSFAIQAALTRVADRHDLSLVQVRLLGILRDREPAMLELAVMLGLDKSSVTGLVDRAAKRGLVKRIAKPEDRRAVHVGLTAAGKELAQSFVKAGEKELAVLVEGLDAADRKRLSALATRVVTDDAQRRMPGLRIR